MCVKGPCSHHCLSICVFLKEAPAVDELILPHFLLLPGPSGCPQAPPTYLLLLPGQLLGARQSPLCSQSLETGTTAMPTSTDEDMETQRLAQGSLVRMVEPGLKSLFAGLQSPARNLRFPIWPFWSLKPFPL